MKKFIKAFGRAAVLVLATQAIVEILKRCKKGKDCKEPKECKKITHDFTDSKYIPNEVVVWKRPGVSDAAFRDWKRKNKPKDLEEVKLCEHCDDSLELWKGDNVSTFISGKGASEGSSAGGGPLAGGGDNIACYAYNFIVDLPEPEGCIRKDDKIRYEFPPHVGSEPPIIIAVFDTGLDPAIKQHYTSPVFSCMPGGELGWNFVDHSANTTDDHPSLHGTVVTQFIIDQATKYKKQKINILPVKVHNKFGKSDLFSILCGFAYAANCGAKIVNASFGFYSSQNSHPPTILSEFVKKHLTDRNILLIAAAGNTNVDRSLVPPAEMQAIRDLDINPFFPACLSADFKNVMAITTISIQKDEVSPSQNFSEKIVDLGVKCDMEIDGDFRFEDSLHRRNEWGAPYFIIGSSYATPIVSGILAQFYGEVISSMENGSINKDNIIANIKLDAPGIITEGNAPLDSLVKQGNCCEK